MDPLIREVEEVLALEAQAHTEATLELNPYSEAETLELGTARAVYTGVLSPVHGVYAAGMDGPFEERDLKEIERFFAKKDRAAVFWLSPAADSGWREYLDKNYRKTAIEKIYCVSLKDFVAQIEPKGNNSPDLSIWPLRFAQSRHAAAVEPDLLSHTKIHQKNTRFYLGENSASYTYFAKGLAFAPNGADKKLFSLQLKDAKEFGAKYFFSHFSSLSFSHERHLYEI